ncbi:MAG: hypothetical protein AB2669_14320 [Candidatus Thiodiazotropha endolucinida]
MSKKQLALWGSFILLEVVTLLVYSNMWMKDWYYYLLAGLGVISILLGPVNTNPIRPAGAVFVPSKAE